MRARWIVRFSELNFEPADYLDQASPGYPTRDFGNLPGGLRPAGFAEADVVAIMGGNWLDFFERSFGPA